MRKRGYCDRSSDSRHSVQDDRHDTRSARRNKGLGGQLRPVHRQLLLTTFMISASNPPPAQKDPCPERFREKYTAGAKDPKHSALPL
jgi:hypothetical protein